MERREIARQLRKLADDDCWSDPDVGAPYGSEDLLLEAAAALEDEDQNARRYSLLSTAVHNAYSKSKCWCIQHGDSDSPYLMSSSEPLGRPHDMSEGQWGWYSTLDAAIDAWIEQQEKK